MRSNGIVIAKFNKEQVLLAIVNLALGALAYAVTFWFFSYAMRLLVENMGLKMLQPWRLPFAWFALGVVTVSGIRTWRDGLGHSEFVESPYYVDLGEPSQFASAGRYYINDITSHIHLFTQIALAGPLQVINAWGRLRSRQPNDPAWERELTELLEEVRAVGKWHNISAYPGRETKVGVLIQMGQIDFNPKNGMLKAAT